MLTAFVGCNEKPVPAEIQLAARQKDELWGAGASVYAPQEYRRYLDEFAAGKELFRLEEARFGWWRDYAAVTKAFQGILRHGEEVTAEIRRAREAESAEINHRQQTLEYQIELLRGLSGTLKDRRLAAKRLMQTEVLLHEAQRFTAAGKGSEALHRLTDAGRNLEEAMEALRPVLGRFADRKTIEGWRRLVDKAVAESRRSGGDLLVINKVARRLLHYRQGNLVKHYEAGMGFNFLTRKLYAGDKATPEGSYRVTRKVPHSRYFRAFLIDYPNDEDRKQFKAAVKKGLVPKRSEIGGLIEIHGGGKQGMTNGCVALDNRDMLSLYSRIAVNTPVVIVGTTDYDNPVSAFLNDLQ